jgi:DNA-binding transcriptional LysR family regulator
MDVEMRHLRYVVAVADELNFATAAQRLRISQPALSARIRDIEAHLGIALFDRTTHGVECTPAGKRFAEQARDVLARIDDAVRECRDSARTAQHRLLVGCYGVAAREIAADILGLFAERHPYCEVQITGYGFEDPSAGLRHAQTQLAFVRPPFDTRGLQLLALVREPRMAGLPQNHRLAGRDYIDVEEVLDDPVVVRRCPDRIWVEFWYAAQLRKDRTTPRLIQVANLDDELQAVASGRAITLTTESAVRHFPRPGIVYVPLRGLPASRIALAWPTDATDPLVAAFVRAAREIRVLRTPSFPKRLMRATAARHR